MLYRPPWDLPTNLTQWHRQSQLHLLHLRVILYTFSGEQPHILLFIAIFTKLSILDRLLTPAILICMILGVVIGEFAPHVQQSFDTARFDSVSVRE